MGSSLSVRIEFILQQLNIKNKFCVDINNDSNKLIDEHEHKHYIFDWLNKYNHPSNILNIEFFKPKSMDIY